MDNKYPAEISRENPSAMLFLIDQSGSMVDPVGEGGQSKAEELASIINRLLQNIIIRCAMAEGVRDYYHVGVIGYGAQVGPAFAGPPLAEKDLVRLSEVAENPVRVEVRTKKVQDGAGGLVDQKVRFPIWFDPVAKGATPMCQALGRAQSVLAPWLDEHPSCFPPVVINITDGEATDHDGDVTNLLNAAESVKELSSSDGNVLLFNVHISAGGSIPIEFPDNEEGLPNEHARILFRMSSLLPDHLRAVARQEEFSVSADTRGFVFNADMVAVIKFLDIGTRPNTLR